MPKGLRRRRQAAAERWGRSFLPAGAPGTRTSTGGLQTRALRPRRAASAAVAASHGRPYLCARGTRGSRPPTCSAASSLGRSGGLSTATLLSRLLTARDLRTRLCASPATPLFTEPSPASAFLLLLLFSAQAPALHVSRAARLPGSQGSQLPPHPPARGCSSPSPSLAARPRFDPHLKQRPGPPSSRPAVLPYCLPPLAVSPSSGLLSPQLPPPAASPEAGAAAANETPLMRCSGPVIVSGGEEGEGEREEGRGRPRPPPRRCGLGLPSLQRKGTGAKGRGAAGAPKSGGKGGGHQPAPIISPSDSKALGGT